MNRIKCGHSEGLFVDKVTTPVRASVSMFTASVFSNLFRELSTSSSLVVGIVCVHCSRRVFERQGEPSNEENHLVYISKFLSIVNAFVDTIQAVNSTPKITTTSWKRSKWNYLPYLAHIFHILRISYAYLVCWRRIDCWTWNSSPLTWNAKRTVIIVPWVLPSNLKVIG